MKGKNPLEILKIPTRGHFFIKGDGARGLQGKRGRKFSNPFPNLLSKITSIFVYFPLKSPLYFISCTMYCNNSAYKGRRTMMPTGNQKFL